MAKILFRPICSKCGKQIRRTIDCHERYTIGEFRIDPMFCPECNEIFTSIEMPTTLPFDNNIVITFVQGEE